MVTSLSCFFFFASGCINVLNHSLPKYFSLPPSIKRYHKCTNCPICTVRKENKVLKGIVPCCNTVFFFLFNWHKKMLLIFQSLICYHECWETADRAVQSQERSLSLYHRKNVLTQPVTVSLTHQEIRSVVSLFFFFSLKSFRSRGGGVQLLGGGGSIQEVLGKGWGIWSIIDNQNKVRLSSLVKCRKVVLLCVRGSSSWSVLSSDISDRFMTDPSCCYEYFTNA